MLPMLIDIAGWCDHAFVRQLTDGAATYTYTIPSGGYRYFKPYIVP